MKSTLPFPILVALLLVLSVSSMVAKAQKVTILRTTPTAQQVPAASEVRSEAAPGPVVAPSGGQSSARPVALAAPVSPVAPVRGSPADAFPKAAQPFGYYRDKSRGWHYKEVIPDEVEEFPEEPQPVPATPPPPPEASPPPAEAQPQGPKPLSAAWIRDNLPKYLDAAIDDPTPQNVSNYLYLQKYSMDASERFAQTYRRVAMADPLLDETAAAPIWSGGSAAMERVAEKGRETVISSLAKEWGIWFFFRSDCNPCHIQAPVLKAFADRYGFSVLAVSVDGGPLPNSPFPKYMVDAGQAAKLGVSGTPTILMVRPPDVVVPLSYGMSSMPELEQRLIELGNEVGAINAKDYESTRPHRRVLMPPMSSSPTLEAINSKSPDAVRDYLKRSITRRIN